MNPKTKKDIVYIAWNSSHGPACSIALSQLSSGRHFIVFELSCHFWPTEIYVSVFVSRGAAQDKVYVPTQHSCVNTQLYLFETELYLQDIQLRKPFWG